MMGIKIDEAKTVVKVEANGKPLPKKGLHTITVPNQEFQVWTFYYEDGTAITVSGNVTIIIETKGDKNGKGTDKEKQDS